MKLKSWDTICMDSFEPKGQRPQVYGCWEINSATITFWPIWRKNQNDPRRPSIGPPKTQADPQMMLIPLRGVVPSIPESFEKNTLGKSGFVIFSHEGPRAGSLQAQTHFPDFKFFNFSKLPGLIDMTKIWKKFNGKGGLVLLWAGPGVFKGTIWPMAILTNFDLDHSEVEKASVSLVNETQTVG